MKFKPIRLLAEVALVAGILAGGSASATGVNARGLALLLHLDEAPTSTRDTGPDDWSVTVNGTAGVEDGVAGRAVRFDDADDWVQVEAALCFGKQTIALWINPADERGEGGICSSQEKPGRSSWRWRISRNRDATVSFHLWDNTMDERTRSVTSRSKLPAGTWSHVAVTIDTSADPGAAKLWVSGVQEGAVAVRENAAYGSLFLGTATAEGAFRGAVDEVAVFDRVLSDEEIGWLAVPGRVLADPAAVGADSFTLRPVGDTAWFTFRHRNLGRRRWMLRMPEYMHRDGTTGKNRTPYGVRWEGLDSGAQLRFCLGLSEKRKAELGLDFRGTVTAAVDEITFELTVTNPGEQRWQRMPMMLFCLQCNRAPGFLDYEAERTYVRQGGRWVTMNEVVNGEFQGHRMCGVGVGRDLSERIAARVSEDGTYVLGIATDIAASLSFNFQDRIACLHSNPEWGLLEPGAEASARGKVYLLKGGLDDLWDRYRQDFEPFGP